MKLVVSIDAADLVAGDLVLCFEEGMVHTREVHEVTKKHVVFLHGERVPLGELSPIKSVHVVREVDGELCDLEVPDSRSEDELAPAARNETLGPPPSHLPGEGPSL